MSRFNLKSPGTKVTNVAGGLSYSQSPELELISILLTSFANDQFYRSANDTFARLISLIVDCDKEFVAKAAVYARNEFGMRSISHVVASELAPHIKGREWAKDFYTAIVHRPDDMGEILSYHVSKNGKIPNAMKKGFAKAFDKFNEYQLAKYKGEGKGFKLVDVVNLVRPIPVEKNAEALRKLIKGELKSFDTFESELSKAGQEATNEEEKAEFKKDVWVNLVKEKKIGYFAILRNLRNIIEQAPEVLTEALDMLTDEKLIKKSLVLPFRFMTAFKAVQEKTGTHTRLTLMALNKAVDLSLNNVPKFEGENLVVLDVSSSMTQGVGDKQSPAAIGALFAASLVKANNCDFITFDRDARYVNLNPMDSTITLANSIIFNGGSTDFRTIFIKANRKYDRVIILSDMQGWVGLNPPTREYNEWKKRCNANPFIYSFDLNSYGSMQFPEQNVFALAGFSEKIFSIMSLLEQDKKALVNTIKATKF